MATPFQIALETDDLAAIRRAPKADLHTHGYLGGDRAKSARRRGVTSGW